MVSGRGDRVMTQGSVGPVGVGDLEKKGGVKR